MKTKFIALITLCTLVFSCNTQPPDKTPASDNVLDTTVTIENADQPTTENQELGEALLKNETFGPLKLGLSATQTKEALGAPEETSNAEEWEADGETHQQWAYKKQGITLDMIGKEEQVINTISITDPCTLKTKRGTAIGSTAEEVKKAYDDVIDKALIEPGIIIAGTVYGGLIFKFENDKVISISAGAVAE